MWLSVLLHVFHLLHQCRFFQSPHQSSVSLTEEVFLNSVSQMSCPTPPTKDETVEI